MMRTRTKSSSLKTSRRTPAQIIRELRDAERLLGEGKTIAEVAKALEISEQTFHRWRDQYGEVARIVVEVR